MFDLFQPCQIFGHGGYGGQYAAADTKHKVGFAYTTCLMDPFSSYDGNGDPRMYSLFDTLYDCVYDIEGIKEERLTFPFYSKYKKYIEKSKLWYKIVLVILSNCIQW